MMSSVSGSAVAQTSSRWLLAVVAERRLEVVAILSLSVVVMLLAVTLEPVRAGDGHYYYAMLHALATEGTPALTESARHAVQARWRVDPVTLSVAGRDGQVYGVHFFFYPLLAVPAYKVLASVDLDVFKAFQLTNAVLIASATVYVLVSSTLAFAARWFIFAGFVLSTASLYFQWPQPEIFSASFVLVASVALVSKRHPLAAWAAALASLQNPSAVLLVVPVFMSQLWGLRGEGPLPRRAIVALAWTVAASLLSLVPYVWSYVQFGVANPIVDRGYIDYSLISFRRLESFVLDLNQGLIVGLPLLLWAMPMAVLLRMASVAAAPRGGLFRHHDLLLIGFVLIVAPTLAQVNWNADHSVFMRYASGAGLALLVWVAMELERVRPLWRAAGMVPAMTLQFAMALYIGGISIHRFPYYSGFMPWVVPIWNASPAAFHPLPEVFFERLVGREAPVTTPAVITGTGREILRVLTRKERLDDVAVEVCGTGSVFVPVDGRTSSRASMHETERGYRYVTGRLICAHTVPVRVGAAVGSSPSPMMHAGWSHPEAWGTWTDGDRAELSIQLRPPIPTRMVVTVAGQVFVNELHKRQVIDVIAGDALVDTWVVEHPNNGLERRLEVDGSALDSDGRLRLAFLLKEAVSPLQLGISGDPRRLAFGLKEIRIEAAP